MSDLIQLKGFSEGGISIDPDFEVQKTNVLMSAVFVEDVTNESESKEGQQALKELKELEKQVEASRKAVKQPVLEVGRKIDGIAKAFLEDVKSEKTRLSLLCGAYLAIARQDEDTDHHELEGTTLRTTHKFEIEDLDVLHMGNPELVELVPNKELILTMIKKNPAIIIPGVKIWKEEKI
ncbi:hypothetical protein N8Z76_00440 [Gammaproteobacteria bacterium]|nr:hypothetical protein [Gammaproteobacteria bacterium]